ncbi:hypothetical protein [Aeromicrobium sp. Root472D3]|uniref:hypothetical protein n=1 Tax=Aeromicrobium sp. Root472D3 TaxID=1736540 RepID=UPI0012F88D61|nr:hypothetical protein [Aeromicrobium sp. Root472D3]
MQLTATIRTRPADGAKNVDDLEHRDIIGTGPTHDDARADLDGQIPDGWQLLYVRAV